MHVFPASSQLPPQPPLPHPSLSTDPLGGSESQVTNSCSRPAEFGKLNYLIAACILGFAIIYFHHLHHAKSGAQRRYKRKGHFATCGACSCLWRKLKAMIRTRLLCLVGSAFSILPSQSSLGWIWAIVSSLHVEFQWFLPSFPMFNLITFLLFLLPQIVLASAHEGMGGSFAIGV